MSEQRNLGAELKAQIEAELHKAASLPPSELETVLAPYLQPLREMFQQIQTVRRAWFTWVEENRESFLRVGQAVHEVAAQVGTFLVEMDEASQRFAEKLREVERLADCGWTVPTELTVSELIDFLRSPDAETAAAYMIQRLDSMDPRLVANGGATLERSASCGVSDCTAAMFPSYTARRLCHRCAQSDRDARKGHPDPEPRISPRVYGCPEDASG